MLNKGMADIEKNPDLVLWNDIKDKRYPNGGICDYCGQESEYLHPYDEDVCRNCIIDINKVCNTNFKISNVLTGGCDFCGKYYPIDSIFGNVKLNLCSNCFSKTALNSKRNNQKKFKFL